MTFILCHTPHGWLVEGLGGNLDIGIYWKERSDAWKHLVYLLSHGKLS